MANVSVFQEEGYVVSCIAVNDPVVMKAWSKSTGAEGKVMVLLSWKDNYG